MSGKGSSFSSGSNAVNGTAGTHASAAPLALSAFACGVERHYASGRGRKEAGAAGAAGRRGGGAAAGWG
eukprot:scaffold6278_cov66-Phaeocystis_antarctica.AAC.1